MKADIILATSNNHKVHELLEIINDPGVTIRTMKEAGFVADPDENGQTFEENAVIKARAVWDKMKAAGAISLPPSDCPVVVMSDDSGLVIDALDGAPGIYSARFMGHDTSYIVKMNAILEKMKDVPDEKRTARFVCAAAAILPDGKLLTTLGTMEGRISYNIAGENGFGYDPFFWLPDFGKTSAQLSEEEKNAISHRGKAFRSMIGLLEKLLS